MAGESAGASTGASTGAAHGIIATTFINAYTTQQQIKTDLKNTLSRIAKYEDTAMLNMDMASDAYLIRLNASYEQREAIDEEMSAVVSRRALDEMKAHAALKTAGASTGLSGTSIEEVKNQTKYDMIMDLELLSLRQKQSKTSIERQKVTDWINYKTQMTSYRTGSPYIAQSATMNPLASGLASGLGTYMNLGGTFGQSMSFQEAANQGVEWNNASGGVDE